MYYARGWCLRTCPMHTPTPQTQQRAAVLLTSDTLEKGCQVYGSVWLRPSSFAAGVTRPTHSRSATSIRDCTLPASCTTAADRHTCGGCQTRIAPESQQHVPQTTAERCQ